jgi:hypothetical protein
MEKGLLHVCFILFVSSNLICILVTGNCSILSILPFFCLSTSEYVYEIGLYANIVYLAWTYSVCVLLCEFGFRTLHLIFICTYILYRINVSLIRCCCFFFITFSQCVWVRVCACVHVERVDGDIENS